MAEPAHGHEDHLRPPEPHRGHAAGHPPEHPAPTAGRAERHAAAHEGHDVDDFRRRFWICLALTVPVLAYSPDIQMWLHFRAPALPGSTWIPLVLSSIIYFYGGSIFVRGAVQELSVRTPGMMTLVALAISVAFGYSVAAEITTLGAPLYWELATLVVVMLLGHWLEMRAVGRARGALTELARLMPDEAERVLPEGIERVPVADLRPADLVLVRPGAQIPADGRVVGGESQVNEAMVTGESRPVSKAPGGEVIAGTVNGAGSLRVRVLKTGDQTTLAGIMRLVADAQESRSQAQALADRAAYWLTLTAIGSGTLTLVIWLVLGRSIGFALERTVSVFVIACPHALGLAIPLVISIATTLSARNGILVRERVALERARDLDIVVFDKTGTLTRGRQGVVGVVTAEGVDENEALGLAAAAEGDSEHSIAQGIREAAKSRGLQVPKAAGFRALPGRGVRAVVEGREVQVGSPRLLEGAPAPLPPSLQAAMERWGREGKTAAVVLAAGAPVAAIALADVIRPESRQAVSRLQAMGIRVMLLTGDSEDVARWVAGELGIDEYLAEVLPEHKAGRIRELKRRGRVAMVGDGINDAPALLTADVGIAIGAGTDVAIESAGIILVRSDPRDVARAIALSRATYRKMIQNLVWATGYNVAAIPLAAGVLAGYGIVLPPAVAALLMSASTVIVALNAQLLRRLSLE